MGKFNIDEQLNDENESLNGEVNIKNNEDEFLILKRESRLKSKAKPIQFYLSDDLINSLDKLCKQTGKKRNELAIELLSFAISKTKVVD